MAGYPPSSQFPPPPTMGGYDAQQQQQQYGQHQYGAQQQSAQYAPPPTGAGGYAPYPTYQQDPQQQQQLQQHYAQAPGGQYGSQYAPPPTTQQQQYSQQQQQYQPQADAYSQPPPQQQQWGAQAAAPGQPQQYAAAAYAQAPPPPQQQQQQQPPPTYNQQQQQYQYQQPGSPAYTGLPAPPSPPPSGGNSAASPVTPMMPATGPNPPLAATPTTPARLPHQQQQQPSQAQQQGQTPMNASMSSASTSNAKPAAKRARPRTTPNKIDSSQVPTPARDLPYATPQQPRPVVSTLKGYAPLSITNFVAQDEGSASAKFMRPTLHSAPHEDGFTRDSAMPWSVVMTPLFDKLEDASEAVPLVQGRPPVRCHRCRSYMTAFTPFSDLGKRWQCLFCGLGNDTESEYFCNLDSYGKRRDALEKPELCRGSVEYDVTHMPDYALKNEAGDAMPTRPMNHLFVLDVSTASKGHIETLVNGIRTNVRAMAQRTPKCRVSFVTYADSLHFYNFSQSAMPQLVVPDVDAPFVPLPFTLLCWMNVAADAERIDAFLDRLVTLPDQLGEDGCAAGAALKVASMILSETGGKVIMTATNAPNCGVGQIAKRDVHKLYTPENEKQLFKPVEGFWPTTAIDCAKRNITVDLTAFPTGYSEMITLGSVPHLTGGSQFTFTNFSPENDGHRLFASIAKSLVEDAGYGAIARVRTSQGIRVTGYHGHYMSNDPSDMDLAGVSSSNTFVVDLKHEGKLDAKGYAYVQLALLYTTRNGERRVRVHTSRLTVCNTHASLYRHADLEGTLTAMVYHTIHTAVNKGTKAARDELTARVLSILIAYRKFCASSSHTGQLLLPEQLKLLPLYALCAMKSDALVPGTSAAIDQRTQSMFDLLSMPVHHVLSYLYPRLYALQTTLNHASTGLPREDGVAGVYMPPLQQLTTDTIMCHGIYALLDRQVNLVYLWIGSGVSPRVSAALFNGQEDAAKVELADFDTWHERIKAVLSQIADEGMARIILIHEGAGGVEESFFRCMLEDEAVQGGQTYSEFLCYLHKQINLKLA